MNPFSDILYLHHTAPQGACAAPEKKTALGVNAAINIGGSLNIEARRSGESDALFTVSIAVSGVAPIVTD